MCSRSPLKVELRWAVKPGVNTATSGDHRVSVLKAGLVIQVKRNLLSEQNAKEIFTSSYQASNYWKSKIITIITLSRYSLFQNTFKRVPKRVLQSLNPNLKFRATRNPEGYFWHPTSQACFHSPILPRFCLEIPHPGLQISKGNSGYRKNLLGTLLEVWFIPPQFCTDFHGWTDSLV